MDYDKLNGPGGAEVRVPTDDSYRTCSQCGGDCYPEPTAIDGLGVRIAFVCPEHGVHSVIDPFEDKR
ncbi:hypothetical protein [uncultured Brachybacterium sp.]|uniref:hypothetical protein n=1 Tax=uncultured Brachybacterium sp. TaxID=189680 RepID=UPI0026075FE1|nr:hypothetical protein [uncultured Brachybacterium sp.]